MRLEQLVLFGPSDNSSIQFGPRVTVLAGLDDGQRSSMLQTLVGAMAGRVPNASVVFVDQTDRRVFADRMGATFADSGAPAPSLVDLLGTDASVVDGLLVVRADDLGVGICREQQTVANELTAAQAAMEQLTAERTEATTMLVHIESLEAELERIDDEIEHAPDLVARWEWIQLRNQLDQLRAERATLDRRDDEDDHDADLRLLEAVDDLRAAGEAWAEASTIATEMAQRLGPLPPVSDGDLARVAATPDQLPDDLDQRIAALTSATAIRTAAEDEVHAASDPPEDPGDGIVYRLAALDQTALWEAHDAAVLAQATYEAELADLDQDIDIDDELAIEAAHHEVVRCQREKERRFRPGALGTASLAVGALLAAETVSVIVGIAMLIGALAMAWWLLVVPRRLLAAATEAEADALSGSSASSWLGLHLRRVDDFTQPADRSALNVAVNLRATTRLDWEELTGKTTLDAATERRSAIEAYAAAIDPRAREARLRRAAEALTAARADEDAARTALTADLDGFGLSPEGTSDLDPSQIRGVLEQRAAAGRFAREVLELQHQTAMATSTGGMLDRLLRQLGFDDGDLAGRLERAIVAVEHARGRRSSDGIGTDGGRTVDHVDAEIARVSALVEQGRRLSWDLSPDPTEPPVDPDELVQRRQEVSSRLATASRPNLATLDGRIAVATDRVTTLETELASTAEGPTSVRRRLADRIARTTWHGPGEESLPVILDECLHGVEPAELFKLLDMVVRLSERIQVILLTGDPTIATWARREAKPGVVALLEADGAIAY